MSDDARPIMQRPFKLAAIALTIGLIIAIIVAAAGVSGPGWFTIEQAIVGLGVAILLTAATLVLVLFRLSDILEQLSKVRADQKLLRAQLPAGEERQHVIVIEGIGEKFATRLNQIGIISVPQLIKADPVMTAQSIEATPQQVRDWQAMGLLMKVKGIGPQYAELLVRSGIKTVSDLARADPAALKATIDAVEARRDVAIQKGEVGEGTTTRWVKAAKQHLP